MKLHKIIILIALTVILLSLGDIINAHSGYPAVTPFWNEINWVDVDISAEGNVLECYSRVVTNTSDSFTATMTLEKYQNGSWRRVTSWTYGGNGYGSISRNYRGVRGTEYRLKLSVRAGGESITEYSDVCMVE